MNRSQNMAAIRSKDTKPEMAVRRLVFSMGFRYRVHRRDLPGKPDLAFMGRRKAIFVHGCFWHKHGCPDAHVPRSNSAYWQPKLARNQARDAEHTIALAAMGWRVLVLWECQLWDEARLKELISKFLLEE